MKKENYVRWNDQRVVRGVIDLYYQMLKPDHILLCTQNPKEQERDAWLQVPVDNAAVDYKSRYEMSNMNKALTEMEMTWGQRPSITTIKNDDEEKSMQAVKAIQIAARDCLLQV